MKPEKDTPESLEAGEQVHPLEVMRQAYEAMDIAFNQDPRNQWRFTCAA